jgi:hypothetical protein
MLTNSEVLSKLSATIVVVSSDEEQDEIITMDTKSSENLLNILFLFILKKGYKNSKKQVFYFANCKLIKVFY